MPISMEPGEIKTPSGVIISRSPVGRKKDGCGDIANRRCGL
jgi:hypothetical protein